MPNSSNDLISRRYWDVTSDLLSIIKVSGHFEDVNPAWSEALGWDLAQIKGRHYEEFLDPDYIAKSREAFSNVTAGDPVLKFVNRYRNKDGYYRWLMWNAVLEGDYVFCSARDFTEDWEARQTLKLKEEEAQFREQFIAVLGHDLRSPVSSISSAVRLMRKQEPSPKMLALLDAVEGSVDRMAAMTGDLMDIARARLGDGIPHTFELENFLEEAIRQVVDEIKLAHPTRDIEVQIDRLPPVECDLKRLEQVVSNLVSNAISHGEASSPIIVEVSTRNKSFFLSVKNHGMPIPDDIGSHLFEPFFQGGASSGEGGLGLGLFIASEIAKAHDGNLDYACEDGEITFYVQMPLRRDPIA